jgi:hypothetical protein
MGVLADSHEKRVGVGSGLVLWTAVPWAVVMILAYTTPQGWSMGKLIAYAAITNTLLMTLYSMNNMPYGTPSGGVMTGDLKRAGKTQFLPLYRGEYRAVHRWRSYLAAGGQVCHGPRSATRLANDDGRVGGSLP